MEGHTHSRFWTSNYEVIESTERNLIGDHSRLSSDCNKNLTGEQALSQGPQNYCWKCLEKGFSFRCVSCVKPITGLSEINFIMYNDHVWHKDCFRCCLCRRSLEQGQVTQDGNSLYCTWCGKNAKFQIG